MALRLAADDDSIFSGELGIMMLPRLALAALAIDDWPQCLEYLQLYRRVANNKKAVWELLGIMAVMSSEKDDYAYAVKFLGLSIQEFNSSRGWLVNLVDRVWTRCSYHVALAMRIPFFQESKRQHEVNAEFKISRMHYGERHYEAGLLHARRALATANTLYPKYHPLRAIALSEYGHMLFLINIMNKDDLALTHSYDYFKEAMDVSRRSLRYRDMRSAIIHHNVAVLVYYVGIARQEERFFAQAEKSIRSAVGEALDARPAQRKQYAYAIHEMKQSLEMVVQREGAMNTVSFIEVA